MVKVSGSMSWRDLYDEALTVEPLTSGEKAVLAERHRQIEREGWSAAHDDCYTSRELAAASACYIQSVLSSDPTMPAEWPWDARWWKPSGVRRDLVKAAALLLAEIDRLDRAERKGE